MPANNTIFATSRNFILRFRYNESLLELVKSGGVARFNPKARTWSIRIDENSSAFIQAIAGAYDFLVYKEAQAVIDGYDNSLVNDQAIIGATESILAGAPLPD